MHIIWVFQFASTPDLPGSNRHHTIARILCSKGHQVEIIASDFNLTTRNYLKRENDDTRVITEEVDGVIYKWLYTSSYKTNNWKRLTNQLRFAFAAYFYLKRNLSPDIIIGASPSLFSAFSSYQVSKKLNIPFVLEILDIWPQTYSDITGKKGLLVQIADTIANVLYNNAWKIFALAKGTVAFLSSLGVSKNKICYAPNGIEDSQLTPISAYQKEKQKKIMGIKNQDFCCVYAGAHGIANGLENIIFAADLLKQEKNIKFFLIGDGPRKDQIMRLSAEKGLDNVIFLSSIPKFELSSVIQCFDLGVLNLRKANVFSYGISPNKLFDYWAASLPVIATVKGEIGDLISEVKGGYSIDPDEPSKLAETVFYAFQHRDQMHEMGNFGNKYVTNHNRFQDIAEKIEEYIKSELYQYKQTRGKIIE